MAENKTIKKFTSADIEKYWNNKLSAAEMHEIEKAAMDDPFFADALEGYKYSKDPGEELSVLRDRLNKKVGETAVVVPLPRKKYAWLRVAAAVIVLAAGGLLIQQLMVKNKAEAPIVDVDERKKNEEPGITKKQEAPAYIVPDSNKTEPTSTPQAISTQQATIKQESKEAPVANDAFGLKIIDSPRNDDKAAEVYNKGDVVQQKREAIADKETERPQAVAEKTTLGSVMQNDTLHASFRKDGNIIAANKSKAARQYYVQSGILNNSFNYRVVDAQNNPVPFANVTNTRDNIGTYTDIKGNFNLVSSDSVLNVQVRSLGFDPETYKLVPSKQPNNLILKENATAGFAMDFYQGQRVMSSVPRKDSAEIEEPEVGWGHYNTYVENNIKIPQNVRAKNALNDVELSFDVDKAGQPINIKVIKSSQCKECDEEAKRLLKEGPKWKRKGKRYKTTISISVDQK